MACPAGVYDREGTSRFPWAFSPVTGSSLSRYGIARLRVRLALCGFVFAPSFRSAATAGGRVSGLASVRATRSAAKGSALTPKSLPAVHCERIQGGRKDSRGVGAGRAGLLSVARGLPCLQRKPRGSLRRPAFRNRQERQSRLPPGSASDPQSPLRRGMGGGRNQPHGQSAAAPVPSCCAPKGGGLVRQGAAAVRARCRADGGPEAAPGSSAVRGGSLAAQRLLERGCTDRSAGGCADRHTFSTTRARALRGRDAAEASPRRCASWRSRGRRWRGPSASATE